MIKREAGLIPAPLRYWTVVQCFWSLQSDLGATGFSVAFPWEAPRAFLFAGFYALSRPSAASLRRRCVRLVVEASNMAAAVALAVGQFFWSTISQVKEHLNALITAVDARFAFYAL